MRRGAQRPRRRRRDETGARRRACAGCATRARGRRTRRRSAARATSTSSRRRAPSAAPVIDSCGVAGGRHRARASARRRPSNTSVARQGDRGQRCRRWRRRRRGARVAEVGWTVMANHGGATRTASRRRAGRSRETFGRTPLDFEGRSALRWDGDASASSGLTRPPAAGRCEAPSPQDLRGANPIPSGLWAREGRVRRCATSRTSTGR